MRCYVVTRKRGWTFCQIQCLWRTYRQQVHVNTVQRSLHTTKCHHSHPAKRSAGDIRSTFVQFFQAHDHQYVHSSGIVPKKGSGTYFINAGMNQFKSIFLGNVEPGSELDSYKRVTNSQKCIRVGGKHNDLEAVGRDTYHHTFFEMLGSWSFGDYWKAEACDLAWELLTQVYGIPVEHLYVTYFSDPEGPLTVEPDLEVKDIWRNIGVPEDHLVAGVMKDNFWDMGETGPCGPCSEIHFDHLGRDNAAHLVNTGDPTVVELWNLVFMQYNRQKDGSIVRLPRQHVDTGMGLERLAAVLQRKLSNYDTDLFAPLFSHLHKSQSIPAYGGRFGPDDIDGVDTAYRIIADHTRMMTVAIADGLRPGRSDLDSKLRDVMYRCFRQAHILGVKPGVIGQDLIPLIVESLGEAFPEIAAVPSEITDIVNLTEERYLTMYDTGHKLVHRVVKTNSESQTIPGQVIWQITQGELGQPVPLEIIEDVASHQGLHLDIESYLAKLKKLQLGGPEISNDEELYHTCLSTSDVQHLQKIGVHPTDDHSKYQFEACMDGLKKDLNVSSQVKALLHDGQFVTFVKEGDLVGIVVDKTCMYAEAGGQAADQGTITGSTSDEDVNVEITDVQSAQGYILHSGIVKKGSLKLGSLVDISVNQNIRWQLMSNHTGTHLLNYALNKVLGSVWQKGSSVTPERIHFDFSCSKVSVSLEELAEVERIANNIIDRNLPVFRQCVPLGQARSIAGLRLLPNEEYPSEVVVVSVGVPVDSLLTDGMAKLGLKHSVELCEGTHVCQTGDLDCLVVSNLKGGEQGTKRITAITGESARKALTTANSIQADHDHLWRLVKNREQLEEWEKLHHKIELSLFDHGHLPKVVREKVRLSLQELMSRGVKRQLHTIKKNQQAQSLQEVLGKYQKQECFILEFDYMKIAPKKDVMDALIHVDYPKPVMFLRPSRKKSSRSESSQIVEGFAYVPHALCEKLDVQEWTKQLCNIVEGRSWPPQGGKHAKHPVLFCSVELFLQPGSDHLEKVILEAQTFAAKNL